MGTLIRRLIHFLRGKRESDALVEELEAHRQLREEQLVAQGLSRPDATATSRRLMGNATLAREDARDVWTCGRDSISIDLRHGLHALRTHRRFALACWVTLTLSLGANLLVFTIVNALWLRPLAVADPDHLVMITNPGGLGTSEGYAAFEAGLERLRHQPVFSGVAGQVPTSGHNSTYRPHIVLQGGAGVVEALAVTPQYFSVAGVRVIGRDFAADDDQPGAEPVAIISDRLWASVFDRDSSLIGATMAATPVPLRVIGVASPHFHGVRLGERVDLWIPRELTSRVALRGMAHSNPPLLAIARLAPGLSAARAQQAMYSDWRQPPVPGPAPPAGFIRAPSQPPMAFAASGQRVPLEIVSVSRLFGSPSSRTLVIGDERVLGVAIITATLVLLGGCATLVALVLVSYEQRRQEFAVRLALGCSRARLTTALLMELAVVFGASVMAALALATVGAQALPALSLPGGLDLTRLDLSADWRVAAFGTVAAIIALGLTATVPLRRSTRPSLVSDLVVSSGRVTASSFRARRFLLAIQTAATVVVLVAAHLFLLTVRDGFTRGTGFDVNRTLFVEFQARSMTVSSRAESQAVIASVAARLHRLFETLHTMPGVEVAAIGRAPLGLDQAVRAAETIQVTAGPVERSMRLSRIWGGPAFLDALGGRLLAGRRLTIDDIRSGNDERPALVTSSVAEALWPDGGAIGQRFYAGTPYQVVGVIADIAQGSLRLDQRASVLAGWSVDQEASADAVSLTLRVRGDPKALVAPVREAINHNFGPLPLVEVTTGREIVSRDLGRERLGAWFFSGFGLVALALGAAGVFGLVGHMVATRRRELGIRLALGATPDSLMRLALSAGLQPVTAGIIVGVAAAAALALSLRASLPGIRPLDAPSVLAMPALLLTCAIAAAVAAGWRVRRTSPVEALRAE
jgi:predicted permease